MGFYSKIWVTFEWLTRLKVGTYPTFRLECALLYFYTKYVGRYIYYYKAFFHPRKSKTRRVKVKRENTFCFVFFLKKDVSTIYYHYVLFVAWLSLLQWKSSLVRAGARAGTYEIYETTDERGNHRDYQNNHVCTFLA